MTKQEIKDWLIEHPGYIKKSFYKLAARLEVLDLDVCKQVQQELRKEQKQINEAKTHEGKILFWDLETSPNIGWFWRAGFKQTINPNQILEERKIICGSYKWLGEDQVYNVYWSDYQDDYFAVEQLIEVINQADLIVGHNSDRFDIKWLRTRALYHGLEMLPNYKSYDTLKVAKSKFYFNSNKLDYISKFLGFEGKIHTTPDLWNKVVIHNDKEALNKMLDYCDEDVRQLEKVYNKLKYHTNPKSHTGVLEGKGKETSPITGNTNVTRVKIVVTDRGTVKHIMKDLDTNRFYELSDTLYKKYYSN